MSFGYSWKPYVPVAERREKAERELAKLSKKGQANAPVVVQGTKIATSFWGKAWCDNLESYSDYANRLPRGRTYVRNGSVVDLQLIGGDVKAKVAGSQLYTVTVRVAPLAKARWDSICKDCTGSIDSLVALLQGQLSKEVMQRVCQQKTGLFPAPAEIELACSCPDWATMCKHVAAVLYGIGTRLDKQPALMFKLRGVDESELISTAAQGSKLAMKTPVSAKVLQADDLSALFGLEMESSQPEPKGHAIAKDPKPARARSDSPASAAVMADRVSKQATAKPVAWAPVPKTPAPRQTATRQAGTSHLKKPDIAVVVARIKESIAFYSLTEQDLFGAK